MTWVRRALAVSACLAAAPLLVVFLLFADSARVETKADQASLSFGAPFNWVVQDQQAYDPPLPDRASFASPWENPSDADAAMFWVNTALVGGAVLAILMLWRAVARRRRIPRGAPRRNQPLVLREPGGLAS